MNEADIRRLCDELRLLTNLGPGLNSSVLREAQEILATLRSASLGVGADDALLALSAGFAQWFSPRQWRGKDHGRSCRQGLYANIGRLESRPAPHSAIRAMGNS